MSFLSQRETHPIYRLLQRPTLISPTQQGLANCGKLGSQFSKNSIKSPLTGPHYFNKKSAFEGHVGTTLWHCLFYIASKSEAK